VPIWPDDVLVYLRGTGRDPAASCPRIAERALADAAQIFPFLMGRRVEAMLDIGCGLALVDMHLARALRPSCVYLLDGAGDAPQYRGYRDVMRPWANVEAGAAMVRANIDRAVEVVTVEPAPFDVPVDLVISTRSWGHHYPVSVYLDSVAQSLRSGGVLAVDLRAGTNGAAEIAAAGFEHVASIDQPPGKCDRVIFHRRG
jgi:SAM-dependent methyltransferase